MVADKTKILFLINSLKIGGAERVFVKDANTFRERGREVFFAVLFGSEKNQPLLPQLTLERNRFFCCEARAFYDLCGLRRLTIFIRKNKINTVYSTLDEGNLVARLLKLFLPKLTITIREANVADKKPLKFKIADLCLNFFANKVIAVSEEVLESLIRYEPWYKGKMILLKNGVDIPDVKKRYENINFPLKLLNIGNLNLKKGQRFLIEACKMIKDRMPESFHLTIVGSGSEAINLKKMINDLGLDDVVTIVLPVSPRELSNYYLDADIFILSSLWEGSPNVLLEAMAHGVASLSTRVGGSNNIIEDGISGKLVLSGDGRALADGIFDMIEHRDMLASLGKEGRKRVMNQYSFNHHIKMLESILYG
ncbi:MAG: glycosyltransferase [Candidatus Zambryskibacteria bacterium]|nr:glycosyltransferase [Candidatus Zambryskibacteria bacterium]